MNCDRFGDGDIKGDANITFIGGNANLATLAHEIGHAFGLRPGDQGGHTNNFQGFDEKTSCGAAARKLEVIFHWGKRFV